MEILDYLIDKDNNEPKYDMEYIYLMDMIWKPNGRMESFYIKEGTIMINIKKRENNSYEFTCKETGEIYQTNYGWSLAENTEENTNRIEEYNNHNLEFKKMKLYNDKLRKNIKTLKS